MLKTVLFLIFCAGFIFAEVEIPMLSRRVTDLAGVLMSSQVNELELKLKRFEDETSNQIAVLIIPTLAGEDLEDFSIRVVEKNKLGQAGKNNGVLFLIVVNDRKMRIEVGYGLEGVLTDALCDQILRNIVRPKFRQGDFFGGINAGVDAIISATRGEFKAEGKGKHVEVGEVVLLFIIGFIILTVILSLFAGARHYTVGSRRSNSTLFWLWLLSSMSERGRGSSWGGFSGGGWSGGGWSGGGGSFGGGGASGSW